jgi:drug/metabolite transporter (DMT)-like permease
LGSHPQFWAYAALISVCFFWGTTYLGIRIALESLPPMTLVSLRYIASGSILLAACLWRRMALPDGKELWRTARNGVMILGVGNGCLALAETWIASGLAALIITVSPFWMIGLNALIPPREPVRGATLAGMIVGLGGAALLVGPGALAGGAEGTALAKGFWILMLGCFSWSFGSLVQRKQRSAANPILSAAIQQLAAGVAVAPLAWFSGGAIHWTPRGAWALVYLIVFGSLVGYTSYIYALKHLPVALVSVHNYLNPVVAVVLGWLFYREPFGPREAVAMAIIFFGVALVKRFERK